MERYDKFGSVTEHFMNKNNFFSLSSLSFLALLK